MWRHNVAAQEIGFDRGTSRIIASAPLVRFWNRPRHRLLSVKILAGGGWRLDISLRSRFTWQT